jgi:hypothetical protein
MVAVLWVADAAPGRGVTIAASRASATGQGLFVADGSTLVVLAQTDDARGATRVEHFRELAAEANRYYALNSYGRVAFDLRFADADGQAGDADWFTVGPRLAAYAADPYTLGAAAVVAALSGGDLPPAVTLERAIVVYPSAGQQAQQRRSLGPACYSPEEGATFVVRGAWGMTEVRLGQVILVSDAEPLGTWVHELGHTLPAPGGQTATGHLGDRYRDARAPARGGELDAWDLMGLGNLWGSPRGAAPTHMSSYTKMLAGWLRPWRADLDRDIPLSALEGQRAGDGVLVLDNPSNDDPGSYYILEARDAEAPFGAPESGVMLYYVSGGGAAGKTVVDALGPQFGDPRGRRGGQDYQRPTLYGAASPEGSSEYVISGGLRVRLLAETFCPYSATVHIEHYLPQPRAAKGGSN